MANSKHTLLIGSRKGLIVYKFKNGDWQYHSDAFLGIPVSYAFADERNGRWWAALDHGHWGCKLHYSDNEGESWEEITAPAYPEGEELKNGSPATLKYIWCMAAGHASRPDDIFLGTDPGGLFHSTDNGGNFALVRSLWDHPSRKPEWFGGGRANPGIHSVVVDPENADRIFIGVSCAGVFETEDGGQSWTVRNKGMKADFLPDPDSEIGQDPHLLVAHPKNTDYMWNQNHCGIFRSRDGGKLWEDISEKDGPANFGFAIALDQEDMETAWVVPAVSDITRVAVDRSLCVSRTTDGGKTWQHLRNGLPQGQTYDITYRHALDITGDTLSFGTTTGNVYLSDDRGDSWRALSHNLPLVYSLRFAP